MSFFNTSPGIFWFLSFGWVFNTSVAWQRQIHPTQWGKHWPSYKARLWEKDLWGSSLLCQGKRRYCALSIWRILGTKFWEKMWNIVISALKVSNSKVVSTFCCSDTLVWPWKANKIKHFLSNHTFEQFVFSKHEMLKLYTESRAVTKKKGWLFF